MPNAWVEHIKKYAKDNILSYVCALSTPECKNTYVKSTPKQKTKINLLNRLNLQNIPMQYAAFTDFNIGSYSLRNH